MSVLMPIDGENRRYNDPILLQLVQQIHDSQLEMDRKLTKHMADETTELADAMNKLFADAFPGGDVYGHRQAHIAWIKEVETRTDFYRTLKKELAKWGLLGFAGWALWALWQAFLAGPHK